MVAGHGGEEGHEEEGGEGEGAGGEGAAGDGLAGADKLAGEVGARHDASHPGEENAKDLRVHGTK